MKNLNDDTKLKKITLSENVEINGEIVKKGNVVYAPLNELANPSPEFLGDWDNDSDLKHYMKRFDGTAFTVNGRLFQVGQEVGVDGDRKVGINGFDGFVTTPTGGSYVMVYDPQEDAFEEVTDNMIVLN